MRRIVRSRPILTDETHRVTSFEIFFDLVFIFALTQILSYMAKPAPTPLNLTQGLILLLLLWMAWTTYTWLANQVRADIGLIPAGTVVAMAAIFVAALVIRDAWRHGPGILDAPLILALAYIVLRGLDIALYFHAAKGDRQMRTTLRIFMITAVLAWTPLVLGAMFGGTAQTLLWAGAFVIDFSGGFVASAVSGWRLRSASHFTERHGLVLIIALGESLFSTGVGARSAVTHGPVLLAALLAFTVAVCLWWLYFKNAALIAGRALAELSESERGRVASNAYSLAHFFLIAGVIYSSLGMGQVIDHLAHHRTGRAAQQPLDWIVLVALYGGVAVYLAGRILFLRLAVRSVPRTQIVAVCAALLLLPSARFMPALAALGLLTAFLVTLVGYEWTRRTEQSPEVSDQQL